MIISKTPLRISFLGGATDLPGFYRQYGGCVLTMAIDKHIYCMVSKRFDEKIGISGRVFDSVDQVDHEIAREALKMTSINGGVDVVFASDIPAEGSGLGSSSTVSVGLLAALRKYKDIPVVTDELAADACTLEIERLNKPIGVQDQYIAAYGGLRFIEFNKDGKITVDDVNVTPEVIRNLEDHMMVFYTGITRKSETILTEQKANIPDKNQVLQKMAQMARDGVPVLESGDIEKFGVMLDEGWRLKKSLASKISNNEIDELYEAAKKAGAYGGKISGAGGGGFLTLLVPENKRKEVGNTMRGLVQMPVRMAKYGSRISSDFE